MKILGLDSTANICTAAICEDNKLIAEIKVNAGNTHSETLLPAVEQVLKLSGTDIDEIELFARHAIGRNRLVGYSLSNED